MENIGFGFFVKESVMNRKVLVQVATVVGLCAIMLFANSNLLGEEKKGNPIVNPSFEQAQGGNPAKWFKSTWSGRGQFSLADTARTGSRSVLLSSENGADISWSQTVAIEPFGRYRLSGWIKTENLDKNTGAGALLNIHDMQTVRTKAITGTTDWTKVEAEFQAAGSTSIHINCLFGGWGRAKGEAWYDDINLEMLEKVVPVSKTVRSKVSIDTNQTFEPISKYVYGQFIEHLGRCIYGGIWAEMLEDRKFYFAVPAKGDTWGMTGARARVLRDSPWKVIGPEGSVEMVKEDAYVGEHTPRITIADEPTGIYQAELGVVKRKKYTGRVILAGDPSAAPIEVSLVWGDKRKERQTVTIKKITDKYVTYPFTFRAGATTDEARLEIVGAGKGAFKIGTVSIMPADNIKGFRKDTLELLKELNSPVYRWPGGNFVSGYDWKDGVGTRDKRPPRTNPAWTGMEYNDVGLHEFIEFCRLLDTEPYIAVNTGKGSVEDAGKQVEYSEGSLDTPMGKWRAENGSKEPFGVKFWAVGNEMYGGWQLGHMPLEEYVKKNNKVAEAMWNADPDAQLIAVGAVGKWTEETLKNCADHMTHISEHFYCQNRGDIVAHVAQIPDNVKRIADAHRRYRRTIDSLEGKDIRIALDEWNYWYGPHPYGELGTRYFHKDALGIARGLHEYFRNSDIYFMANYAQTVNVIGCIKTTKTQAFFAATGIPLMLYREQFGTIPVKVDGSTEKLDVAAAFTENKKALTVAVVNATWDTHNLTIDFPAAKPAGKAKTWIIANENPLAYNNPGEEPGVAIQQGKSADITGTLSIKPLSIVLYRVPVK